MEELDLDGDGKVSEEEFKIFVDHHQAHAHPGLSFLKTYTPLPKKIDSVEINSYNLSKDELLRDLKHHLAVYRELHDLFIHYSGHSTLREQPLLVKEAGAWACGAGEVIPIEAIVE